MRKHITTIVVAAVVAMIFGGAGAFGSSLITGSQIAPHTITRVNIAHHSLSIRDLSRAAVRHLRGERGPAGRRGPAGDSASSGGLIDARNFRASATLSHIGGSWSSGHTVVGTFPVIAGSYLVSIQGDFYKASDTDATPILQIQVNGVDTPVTAYTGVFPQGGVSGADPNGVPNGLEQTASAYAVVQVTQGNGSQPHLGTLEVDAFGYNPDRGSEGSGDFAVNATMSVVRITPGIFTKD